MVSVRERLLAAGAAVALLGLLMVAASLRPSGSGHGTHEQLGLPMCGWLAATGRPCPTCGMTTAFAAAANRQPWAALKAQPFAALLALATAVGFWGCMHVAIFGSRVGSVAGKLMRPRVMWIVAAAWGLSWVWKIATWGGT